MAGRGQLRLKALGWRLRSWWCHGGPGKVRGEKEAFMWGGGEGRSEDEASGDGKGHRGVGDAEGDRRPWEWRFLEGCVGEGTGGGSEGGRVWRPYREG